MSTGRRILLIGGPPCDGPARPGGAGSVQRLYRALDPNWTVTLLSLANAETSTEVVHGPSFVERVLAQDAAWDTALAAARRLGLAGQGQGMAFALAAEESDWQFRREAARLARLADLVVHVGVWSEPLLRDMPGCVEVLHLQDLALNVAPGGADGAGVHLAWTLERRLARRAAAILAPDPARADLLRILHRAGRATVIRNGLDPAWTGEVARRRARRQPRRPGERAHLLHPGFGGAPDLAALEALIGLARSVPEADLTVAGAPPDAVPAGLPANLRLNTAAEGEALGDLLAEADAVVVPEPAWQSACLDPAAVLACGLPMVATPEALAGLDLVDGTHAWIRPAGAGLLAAVRQVLDQPHQAALVTAMGSLRAEALGRATAATLQGALEGALAAGAQPRPGTVLALNDYPVGRAPAGGAVRIRETLSRLGRDVVLLSFGDHLGAERLAPTLAAVTIPKTAAHRAFDTDLRRTVGVPADDVAAALLCADIPLACTLTGDLADDAAVVVFEHCYMAPLLDAVRQARPDIPVVYAAHNVEASHKARLLQGSPARAAVAPFVSELEARLVQAATLVVACTDHDAAAFRAEARDMLVVPHGARVPCPMTARQSGPDGPQRPVVGFIGSAHGPNLQAATFILQEIAPRLPAVDFELVGSLPIAAPPPPNVRMPGRLSDADLSRAMADWSLGLNPAEGGGASLKVATYLAHGVPVVATAAGARGYPLAQALGLVVERPAFAAAIGRLLADQDGLAMLARAARAYAAEHLDWDRLMVPYRAALEALARPSHRTRAPAPAGRPGRAARPPGGGPPVDAGPDLVAPSAGPFAWRGLRQAGDDGLWTPEPAFSILVPEGATALRFVGFAASPIVLTVGGAAPVRLRGPVAVEVDLRAGSGRLVSCAASSDGPDGWRPGALAFRSITVSMAAGESASTRLVRSVLPHSALLASLRLNGPEGPAWADEESPPGSRRSQDGIVDLRAAVLDRILIDFIRPAVVVLAAAPIAEATPPAMLARALAAAGRAMDVLVPDSRGLRQWRHDGIVRGLQANAAALLRRREPGIIAILLDGAGPWDSDLVARATWLGLPILAARDPRIEAYPAGVEVHPDMLALVAALAKRGTASTGESAL